MVYACVTKDSSFFHFLASCTSTYKWEARVFPEMVQTRMKMLYTMVKILWLKFSFNLGLSNWKIKD